MIKEKMKSEGSHGFKNVLISHGFIGGAPGMQVIVKEL